MGNLFDISAKSPLTMSNCGNGTNHSFVDNIEKSMHSVRDKSFSNKIRNYELVCKTAAHKFPVKPNSNAFSYYHFFALAHFQSYYCCRLWDSLLHWLPLHWLVDHHFPCLHFVDPTNSCELLDLCCRAGLVSFVPHSHEQCSLKWLCEKICKHVVRRTECNFYLTFFYHVSDKKITDIQVSSAPAARLFAVLC